MAMHDSPRLTTEVLVIGHSLEALQFASTRGGFLLLNSSTSPSFIADKERADAWHRLSFELGMRGLLPIPSAVESIRIDGAEARVTTEFYRLITVCFKEVYVFDLDCVEGLNAEEKIETYVVYDWFNIRRGCEQAPCVIKGPRDFLRELVLYPSVRIDGNPGRFKDCYAKSYVGVEDLDKFEYSETAAKFAALRMLTDNGFEGPPREVGDRQYHLSLVLEHARREMHKHTKEFVIGEDPADNIFYCNASPICK